MSIDLSLQVALGSFWPLWPFILKSKFSSFFPCFLLWNSKMAQVLGFETWELNPRIYWSISFGNVKMRYTYISIDAPISLQYFFQSRSQFRTMVYSVLVKPLRTRLRVLTFLGRRCKFCDVIKSVSWIKTLSHFWLLLKRELRQLKL